MKETHRILFLLARVMKSLIPCIMAGVVGIYGLIVAMVINTGVSSSAASYTLFEGFSHLAAGLAGRCRLKNFSAAVMELIDTFSFSTF